MCEWLGWHFSNASEKLRYGDNRKIAVAVADAAYFAINATYAAIDVAAAYAADAAAYTAANAASASAYAAYAVAVRATDASYPWATDLDRARAAYVSAKISAENNQRKLLEQMVTDAMS
jgi:predicted lipid-binding transport protein (Tim44 family)